VRGTHHCPIVLLLFYLNRSTKSVRREDVRKIPLLPSTRDYSEAPDRLEVQVPTAGKPFNCERSDTQEERVREFTLSTRVKIKESNFADFVRSCDPTKGHSVSVQSNQTTTQRQTFCGLFLLVPVADTHHRPNYGIVSTSGTE
jgi:hypothetical protein